MRGFYFFFYLFFCGSVLVGSFATRENIVRTTYFTFIFFNTCLVMAHSHGLRGLYSLPEPFVFRAAWSCVLAVFVNGDAAAVQMQVYVQI